MRSLLDPLIAISYQSEWLSILAGLVVTVIIIPIVKSLFFDLAKRRISSLLEKESPKTATLGVLSTGEEKTIEVKKKPPDKKSP